MSPLVRDPVHQRSLFFGGSLQSNALQPTVVGTGSYPTKYSYRNLYFACTGLSSPRGVSIKLSLTHLTAGADPGTVAQGREAQRLLPSTPKASMLPPATPSHSSSTPRTMPYHNTTNIRRAVPSHVLFTVTERGVGRVGGHGHTRH
jgi:hypothetical protein